MFIPFFKKIEKLNWPNRARTRKPIGRNECGIVFLQIFQNDIQFFHHSSVLFDRPVQFAFITGLQLVSGIKSSLALSEQPSTLRKIASFTCKISNCVDRSNKHSRRDTKLLQTFLLLMFEGKKIYVTTKENLKLVVFLFIQLSLTLIFIFTVVELFFARCLC